MTGLRNMTVDILIITALPEELETVRRFLPQGERVDSKHCELTYYQGSLDTEQGSAYSYGLTCLFQMGNTDAGVGASHSIRDLNPSYVFMFGVAAGIKEHVELADVIVPTRIFYYEQAKLHPGRVEIRPQSYQADVLLCSKLKDFASTYEAECHVRFGPFAVGEKVIADGRTVAELKKHEPKLLGIEMESYGVARAAAGACHRPRFIAVRGTSDFADVHKDDRLRGQALQNAASFLIEFLRTGVLPKDKVHLAELDTPQTLIAIQHLSLNQRTSVNQSIATTIREYQGFEVQELLIDQTDLYEDGRLANPQKALQRQLDLVSRLRHFVRSVSRRLHCVLWPGAHPTCVLRRISDQQICD